MIGTDFDKKVLGSCVGRINLLQPSLGQQWGADVENILDVLIRKISHAFAH